MSNSWSTLTQRESYRFTHSHPLNGGNSPEQAFYSTRNSVKHRSSNRYSNILAYDRTAVSVDGEYLNANVVKDRYGGWWVASQAPIPATIPLFFQAIERQSASKHPLIKATTHGAIIVQLTGYEEHGVKKADRYLNTIQGSSIHVPALSSTLVEGSFNGVPVSHYHFDAWPDHGVPRAEDQNALRALILEVGRRQKEEHKEVWVHCSAGIGRSGAFIALSSLLLRTGQKQDAPSPLGPFPIPDDVAETIDGLREYRGMLVQTEEQFDLVRSMHS